MLKNLIIAARESRAEIGNQELAPTIFACSRRCL
jgi:hypothetical protein